MQAFHNDPAVKAKYVNRIAAHIAADNLIHGIGWGNGKGCAVGCTFEAYEHARGPVELGLPEWLMRLEDRIYEGLSAGESRDFVAKFLAVIPVGADVEPVRHKLAIRRIDRLLSIQRAAVSKNDSAIFQAIAALETVRRCHEAELIGNPCDWLSAQASAWSSARAAETAAWASGASPAQASAWSTASAAVSAGWSAQASAWSSARAAQTATELVAAAEAAVASAASGGCSAAWRQEAADLLELLEAA